MDVRIALLTGLVIAFLASFATVRPALAAEVGLSDALDEFREDGHRVLYSTDLVRPYMRVDTPARSERNIDWLREALAEYDLVLSEVSDGWYIVARDTATRPDVDNAVFISGTVLDEETGVPIPGAIVNLNGGEYRTRTLATGDFLVAGLPPGSYTATVTAPGFAAHKEKDFEVVHFASLDIKLKRMPFTLEDVTVSTSRYSLLRDLITRPMNMSLADIEAMPNPGDDTLRAITRIPGVANGGASAQSYVRGGDLDETLVLLDGIELYDPFHLKDFQSVFSAIDPRAIDSVDIYSGGFPAQYGNHMSGVLNISTRRPPATRQLEVLASVFNVSFLSKGVHDEGKGSWLFSARRGNLDAIAKVGTNFGRPRYFDVLGQYRYALTDTLDVSVNTLLAEDSITFTNTALSEQADADYSDRYFWLRFDGDHDQISSRTWVSHARLSSSRSGFIDEPESTIGDVDDQRSFDFTGVKSEWLWNRSDRWNLGWGVEFWSVQGNYNYRANAQHFGDVADIPGTLPPPNFTLMTEPSGTQFGTFASSKVRVTDKLSADFGLRWDRQTYVGDGDEQTSPRVALLYELRPATRLRASWGRFYQPQGISELQVEAGITTFFNAQEATHTILGVEHEFENGIDLRVEGYRKQLSQLRPRVENVWDPLVLLPELEPDRVLVSPEAAHVDGLEVTLSSEKHRQVSWWTSYVWSSADDVIMGENVPRSWDQTHTLKFGLLWDRGPWSFSFAGIYHTGWPYTPGVVDVNDELALGPRNSVRFNSFQNLDFKVARRFPLKKGTLTAFFEVTNVFDAKNGCCIDYEIDDDGPVPMLETELSYWLPRIPSVGIIWERTN